MRGSKRVFCGLVTVLLLFANGCSMKNEIDTQQVMVALTDDIVSLDAPTTKDVLSESVIRCVFSTLYTFDENLNLVPCLAESSEHNSDLEWTFQLRENAKFQDGSPVTAEDVKYSLERAMIVEQADKALLIIDKIEAADKSTVKITTKEPCVDLSSMLVRVSTSIMSKKALENPEYDFNRPVGSGPFKVLERKEGEEIRMERFDGYFLEPAKTKYLTFAIEPSEQKRTAGLLNQEYDVVFRISSQDCDYLKLNESVHIYESDSTKMELLTFNSEYPPFDNILVRQAIAHAIDRQNLVDNIADGYGKPLNSMIPEPIIGAKEMDGFVYDQELAKELLQQAGYQDGLDLTVLNFDASRKKMMEYIKLDLAKVGIRMNYESLSLNDYLERIKQNEYMATVMSWTSNPDPDSTFSQVYSKSGDITVNHSKLSIPRVEELILEGKKESDPQRRREIYEEANKLVADSYYIIALYQPKVLVAASKNIEGVRINPQGIFGYENLYRKDEK